jgi:prolyl-tRNA editing enzyme YbaK/EbsC (Cys-tRNA(Pro) deacylase)
VRSFSDVHQALAAAEVDHEIIHLGSSVRSARSAADALGVPVAQVLKSLVFLIDGHPVLAVVPGDATVDADALAHALGAREVGLASGRQVRDLTGYKAGSRPAGGLGDRTAGGGTTRTMLKIAGSDLQALLEPHRLAIGSPTRKRVEEKGLTDRDTRSVQGRTSGRSGVRP